MYPVLIKKKISWTLVPIQSVTLTVPCPATGPTAPCTRLKAAPGNPQTERPRGEIEYLGSIPCITISSCLHSIMSFVNIAWKYGIEAAKTIRWALNLWSPICGQSEIQREILRNANTKPNWPLPRLKPGGIPYTTAELIVETPRVSIPHTHVQWKNVNTTFS